VSGGRLVALCSACGIAGIFFAILLAATPAGAQEGTTETVPPVTATETAPPVTTAPPTTTAPVLATPRPKRKQLGPRLIQPGVTIGGVLVGGLTQAEARELVERRFLKPVTLVVSPTRRLRAEPRELGAAARLREAVKLAVRVRREGFLVPLKVEVPTSKLERFLTRLGKETHRDPVDSRLILRKLRPFATKSVPGRRLKEVVALQEIRQALKLHAREPILLPFEDVRPKVTESDLGKVIVIRRDSKRLLLYTGAKLKRAFRIATGQSSYPTPLGKYEIINRWRHPWWYPPQGSAWAAGAKPVPPGPGNPLGTRWMGISAPYVGIHGTPDAASIGYSASHGCVRMLIPEVEWLFERVEIGTPVFIVSA
jgi:lipoprotein-anchoring transpeptidase ErfK/SrfK